LKFGKAVLATLFLIMLLACPITNTTGYRFVVEPKMGLNQVSVSDSFNFSTYLGGDEWYSDDDRGGHACIGPDGTIYALIYSETEYWPMVNAINDSFLGEPSDIVLVQMSADGTELLYSTFLGGDGLDFPAKMEIDGQGNVYIVGSTRSTDFATPGSYDETFNGNDDVFVMKLNPDTNTVHYATYIGGSSDEHANSLVVDSSGNVYVTGITHSNDFPIVNGVDGVFGGGTEAFILKLNTDGTELLFSTYIGGSGYEEGNDIAIGPDGDVCITGKTGSIDFNCSDGTFDTTLNGSGDGFITKIKSDGSEIIYSTLIGGIGTDSGQCLIFDDAGNLYVTGTTHSPDFPTLNAYDDSLNGVLDVFLLKMSELGSYLLYSTYIGGIEADMPRGICLDAWGYVVIQGGTNSDDFPMANAFDDELSGEVIEGFYIDCFVLKLDINSNWLHFSTYMGGSQNEDSGWIDYDDNGNIVICGMTTSSDFPVSNDSIQNEYYRNWDVFVAAVHDWGDMDDDDLLEFQEISVGTDSTNPDSDFDSIPDGWEFHNGLNPLIDDSLQDIDWDELINIDEYLHGTDPRNPDSDFDSFQDGWEVANGFDPLNPYVPIPELLLFYLPIIAGGVIIAIMIPIVYFFRPKPEPEAEERVVIDVDETRRALRDLTEDIQSEAVSEANGGEETGEGVDDE
jgi:hypothetical protein